MSININIASSSQELELIYALRIKVFVLEQKVPIELEIDEEDKTATHVLASLKNEAVGCGRILIDQDHAHIGRVAVKKKYRGRGIGKLLTQYLITVCKDRGAKDIVLHAQLHALKFYKALGFQAYGDIFLDAGIEHREMILNL